MSRDLLLVAEKHGYVRKRNDGEAGQMSPMNRGKPADSFDRYGTEVHHSYGHHLTLHSNGDWAHMKAEGWAAKSPGDQEAHTKYGKGHESLDKHLSTLHAGEKNESAATVQHYDFYDQRPQGTKHLSEYTHEELTELLGKKLANEVRELFELK